MNPCPPQRTKPYASELFDVIEPIFREYREVFTDEEFFHTDIHLLVFHQERDGTVNTDVDLFFAHYDRYRLVVKELLIDGICNFRPILFALFDHRPAIFSEGLPYVKRHYGVRKTLARQYNLNDEQINIFTAYCIRERARKTEMHT